MKKKLLALVCIILTIGYISLSQHPNNYTIGIIGDFNGQNNSLASSAVVSAHHALSDLELDWTIVNIQYDSNTLTQDIKTAEVDILIGPFLSSELIHCYAELYNLEIPVFVVSATTNFLNDKSDYFYRLALSNKQFGQAISSNLMTYDYDRILFLYDVNNEAFTLENADTISSNLEGIHYKLFSADNDITLPTDYASYDMIYIVASPEKTAQFINKLRNLKYEDDIFLGPWSSNPRVIDQIKVSKEGLKVHTMNYSDKPFYEIYKEKFKNETGFDLPVSGLFSYEIISFLNELSTETDITNGFKIDQYLSENPHYEGYFVNTSLDDVGNGVGIVHTLKIIDNQYSK